jgi:hypothetical protein
MSAASPSLDGGTDSRFTLRLPESWYDFSLADEAAENRIARSVWENCRATGVEEKVAAQFLASVRRAVRQARRAGALHAGGTFEVYEDGLLVASVVVAAVVPPSEGDVLDALLGLGDTSAPSGTWYRVGTTEIPDVGTAARLHGVQDIDHEGEVMRCALMHTVVPVPGSSHVLVVTGTSPNLAEADELFALFEEITKTLRLSGPQPVGGGAPAA